MSVEYQQLAMIPHLKTSDSLLVRLIRLINALSTGGFSIQTSKNGKGTIGLNLTGHVSVASQDEVPMEFYVSEGDGAYLSLTPNIITFAADATTHENITIAHKPAENSTVTFTSSDSDVFFEILISQRTNLPKCLTRSTTRSPSM